MQHANKTKNNSIFPAVFIAPPTQYCTILYAIIAIVLEYKYKYTQYSDIILSAIYHCRLEMKCLYTCMIGYCEWINWTTLIHGDKET